VEAVEGIGALCLIFGGAMWMFGYGGPATHGASLPQWQPFWRWCRRWGPRLTAVGAVLFVISRV